MKAPKPLRCYRECMKSLPPHAPLPKIVMASATSVAPFALEGSLRVSFGSREWRELEPWVRVIAPCGASKRSGPQSTSSRLCAERAHGQSLRPPELGHVRALASAATSIFELVSDHRKRGSLDDSKCAQSLIDHRGAGIPTASFLASGQKIGW